MLDFQRFLKIAERLNAVGGALDLNAVERIAFVQPKLAANDLVLRQRITVDIYPFDKHARTFGNVEVDTHRQRFFVALEIGINVGKRITEQTSGFRQRLYSVLDLFRVIPVAGFHRQSRSQPFRCEIANLAIDLHFSEFVTIALFHHIRDDKILLVRRQFGNGRNHAEIGIALRQIKLAQFLLVESETIGIVARARAEKAVEPRLLGNHFTAQVAVGKFVIADDVNLLDLGLRPFSDFKHDIDTVLVELHHFRLNGCSKTPLALVQFDNARDIGADLGARENLTRSQLDFGFDLVVFKTLVAFEDDPVDHRVFTDFYNHRASVVTDRNVCKQFGCIKVFERLVGTYLVPCLTGAKFDIRSNSVRLQSLCADNGDRLDLLALRRQNYRCHNWFR